MPATATPTIRRTGSRARPNPRPVPRSSSRPVAEARDAAPHRSVHHTPVTADRNGSATRGRLVGIAVAVAIALATVAIGFTVGNASATLDGPPPEPTVYVVKPGDTLWAIAAKVAPDGSPERVVSALRSAAGTAELVPGQQIELPRTLS